MQDIYLRKVVGKENKVIGVAQQGAGRPAAAAARGAAADCLRRGPAPDAASRPHREAVALLVLTAAMDLATFLIQCLNSVQYGLLLFLVATGLTLIFGIMGVINLAHGSFYMIGAYLAYVAGRSDSAASSLALLLGLRARRAAGYVLEWLLFSSLYERDHLQQVLMTYGLILVFEELRSILWSATTCTACRCRPLLAGVDPAERHC